MNLRSILELPVVWILNEIGLDRETVERDTLSTDTVFPSCTKPASREPRSAATISGS